MPQAQGFNRVSGLRRPTRRKSLWDKDVRRSATPNHRQNRHQSSQDQRMVLGSLFLEMEMSVAGAELSGGDRALALSRSGRFCHSLPNGRIAG